MLQRSEGLGSQVGQRVRVGEVQHEKRRTGFGSKVAEDKFDVERSYGALAISAGSLDCANQT